MQVDPSACADINISENKKDGVSGEEVSKQFTAKLEPYLTKFSSTNLFQMTQKNHLH